jgi:transposase
LLLDHLVGAGEQRRRHLDAERFDGGVPRLIVPDNAKVAVVNACLYEPQANRSYAEMVTHYGTAVLPTRPRDKAKIEACVLIVER